MNTATNLRARIAVGTLFLVTSLAGAAFIYFHWFKSNSSIASTRAIVFVVVMGCVGLAGYLLYEKQFDPKPIEVAPEESESNLSPLYWSALRFGILVQAILGMFTALLLDGGQAFGVFKIAFIGHWFSILLLVARRPTSPTKSDIVFIRWGTPLLMLAMSLIAPIVWKIIGQSHLSGWQRLWSGWTRR